MLHPMGATWAPRRGPAPISRWGRCPAPRVAPVGPGMDAARAVFRACLLPAIGEGPRNDVEDRRRRVWLGDGVLQPSADRLGGVRVAARTTRTDDADLATPRDVQSPFFAVIQVDDGVLEVVPPTTRSARPVPSRTTCPRSSTWTTPPSDRTSRCSLDHLAASPKIVARSDAATRS
jgi:hypothetical protein